MVNGAVLDGKSRMQEESKVIDTQRLRRRILASYHVHTTPHLVYLTSVTLCCGLKWLGKYGEVGGAKLWCRRLTQMPRNQAARDGMEVNVVFG